MQACTVMHRWDASGIQFNCTVHTRVLDQRPLPQDQLDTNVCALFGRKTLCARCSTRSDIRTWFDARSPTRGTESDSELGLMISPRQGKGVVGGNVISESCRHDWHHSELTRSGGQRALDAERLISGLGAGLGSAPLGSTRGSAGLDSAQSSARLGFGARVRSARLEARRGSRLGSAPLGSARGSARLGARVSGHGRPDRPNH